MLDVLASCTRRSEEGRPPLAPTRRRWRLRSLWSWERRAHQGSRPPCGRSAGRSGWPTASQGGGLVDAEYRSGRDHDVGDRVLSPGPATSKMWVLLQSVRVLDAQTPRRPSLAR